MSLIVKDFPALNAIRSVWPGSSLLRKREDPSLSAILKGVDWNVVDQSVMTRVAEGVDYQYIIIPGLLNVWVDSSKHEVSLACKSQEGRD